MKTENQHTPNREDIDTGRIFAEMLKFFAEREKLYAETQTQMNEREKLRAEAEKMQAEAQKLNAETKWHPIRFVGGVAISTIILMAAAIGILKAFL